MSNDEIKKSIIQKDKKITIKRIWISFDKNKWEDILKSWTEGKKWKKK